MKLICGDSLSELKNLDADSIDALVTDPPAGISFMGKAWDGDKGGRKQWIAWMAEMMGEASRVLKPGAHALVWALPRTSHWTATALEDAGYEIRDVIIHLFGSGFPKSLDVGKAIDKAAGANREIIGSKNKLQSYGHDGNNTYGNDKDRGGIQEITAPATDAAKQWDGWGTALKPASEHWILARKPLSEPTVAANVLKWGTGAINIDGCRIGTDTVQINTWNDGAKPFGGGSGHPYSGRESQGRFPSNVVLDQEAAALLDEQSGELHAPISNGDMSRKSIFSAGTRKQHETFNDSGGASRFFYVAKPSRAERNDGLSDREMQRQDPSRKEGNPGGDNPRNRGLTDRQNHHPTIKAVEFMRYLCRLITPPKGLILDPFMGSGSTGIAAHQEGFDFIGIEREIDYFEIAKARIKAATSQQRLFT